jgi:methylmalonyl-CoA mutase
MMQTELLLAEFQPIKTVEWDAAIARDLDGADYEKKLIWHTEEGFAVKPFYRAEDLRELASLDAGPGEFPYRRGGRANGDWQIREEIDATDPKEANSAAIAAIAAGAEGIAFSKVQPKNSAVLSAVLANLGEIPVHFERADERLIRLLIDRLSKRRHGGVVTTGCDALAGFTFANEVIGAAPAGFVPFTIHGEAFEEAGATAVEEIGFALAAGVDFLAAMQERGSTVDSAAASIEFCFAVGSSYFHQIAKLRAFRMVWSRAVESFGGTHEGARARIAVRTSPWNKTIYDSTVNILRETTEAMSAVLGGADSVTVAPFDVCCKKPDEASRRLARNTQLLLKNEAWLGRVADAAGGSYYLEALTELVARESWRRMQEIEAQGGFRKAQAMGTIARALAKSMAAREKAVTSRRRVFVGTNQYANPGERALARVDEQKLDPPRRGAQMYEELRLRTERHAAAGRKTPRVLLAEIGDVKMRGARSNFAANFFACAGFEIQTRRFKDAEGISAVDTDLIVLCSADGEYAELAAELMPRLKALGRTTPVVVAGNPASAGELRAAGIEDFVHVRSNPLEVLREWQGRLGIRDK